MSAVIAVTAAAELKTAVAPTRMFDGLTRQERELKITSLIERAGKALHAAVESGESAEVMAAYKDQAAALADLSKRVDVSKDAVLDAQVLQRRAERGLGIAIRHGQAEGAIRTQKDGASVRDAPFAGTAKGSKASPYEFASNAELYGDKRGTNSNGIYALADNGSPQEFDRAVSDARAEGNVSRANVVRKLKAQVEEPEVVGAPTDAPAVADPFEVKVRELAEKLPTMAAVYEQVKDGYGSGYSAFTGWCRRHGIEFEFRDPRAWEKYALSQRGVLERSSETVSAAARFLSELDVRALDPERIPEALERLGDARTNLTKAIRKLEELA
jgi:hypothetical protein